MHNWAPPCHPAFTSYANNVSPAFSPYANDLSDIFILIHCLQIAIISCDLMLTAADMPLAH